VHEGSLRNLDHAAAAYTIRTKLTLKKTEALAEVAFYQGFLSG
jgi:hypothetical protein